VTFRIIKINSESMTLQKWFRKTAVVLKIVSKADYYMYCKSKRIFPAFNEGLDTEENRLMTENEEQNIQ
jgi:hypothetical protein